MLRRMIGLALGAFMLHLNVERADLACATHSHGMPASEHSEHAMDGHHGAAPESAPSDSHEDCPTPAQTDCCQTMVSCSIGASLSAERDVAEMEIAHAAVMPVAQSHPTSLIRAPEPPPPRA
jgi:hypothetical protein